MSIPFISAIFGHVYAIAIDQFTLRRLHLHLLRIKTNYSLLRPSRVCNTVLYATTTISTTVNLTLHDGLSCQLVVAIDLSFLPLTDLHFNSHITRYHAKGEDDQACHQGPW